VQARATSVTLSADREDLPFESLDDSGALVHIWSADLDDPAVHADALVRLLSPDEQARAARFRYERDRRRFSTARGLLRVLLGGYLNQNPAAIEFAYGPSGKPKLRTGRAEPSIHFNLAHADSCALFGFVRGSELGIDVEKLQDLPDLVEFAGRFFSPGEAERVVNSDTADRVPAFFRCWTRKEAFIKALGDGLSRPLDSFAVTVEAGRPPRIEWALGEPEVANLWSLHHLEPRIGYVAAVALPRANARVKFHALRAEHRCCHGICPHRMQNAKSTNHERRRSGNISAAVRCGAATLGANQ
jgi:4'-phosphopantetheinyl transferase